MKRDGVPTGRSHPIVSRIIKLLSFLYTRIFIGFRCRDRYHVKDGESVLVLSNHQTDYDPFCIIPSFSRIVYPVATDNIFSGRFVSRVLSYLNVIPKKKGVADVSALIQMRSTLKNGASVLLFPEGNRSYAEFQYYINPGMAKFIKSTGATVVLFNIHGGSGISPRFKHKNRRGRFYGEISRVIPYEEYREMDDGELFRQITDGIRVFDSDSGDLYKSIRRAEYLERMLFACPKCGASQTLVSEKQYIKCRNCGLTVEYGEDLHLKSDDPAFVFSRLIDWWSYQKKYVREMEILPGKAVFSDSGVKLFSSEPFEKKVLLASGDVSVDDTSLRCSDRVFDVAKIEAASVVSGRNLTFVYEKKEYTMRGNVRFNPLKYAFLFNRLDTLMKLRSTDKYYNTEE